MIEQNKAGLMDFLDFVSSKSLMKKSTAGSLKSACSAVFSILDEHEEQDIASLDLESVFQRFENAKGMEVNPDTLRAYRNRVKQAVSEFQRYKENPSQWKPSGTQRSSKSSTRNNKSEAQINGNTNGVATSPIHRSGTVDGVEGIVHRFPLRQDTIVCITGIPFNVTKAEMARMTAFLSNLVAESEDEGTTQLMLPAQSAEQL